MKGLILAATLVAGCSGDDAKVAGNYTVALTNGTNGCNLGNFNPGATSSGISLVITQQASTLTATVEGVPGLYLQGLLGGGKNVFNGSVSGNDLDLEALGSKSNTSGNCTYTYNATIGGSLDGDVLRGKIEYRAADNGNPDCSAVHGCVTFQDYNGTRPPQ